MPRWITFTDATAARLHSRSGETFEVASGNPLDAAIASGDAIAVLPAAAGDVLVATLRRMRVAASQDESTAAIGYSAGGFLGLSDNPIYDEEPAAKKRWWQKILE